MTSLGDSNGVEGYRHVSRAGTKIEHARVRARKNMRKHACRAAPPQFINVHRQDVVGQIVAWGNLIKHALHGLSGSAFICGFGGFGAANRRFL